MVTYTRKVQKITTCPSKAPGGCLDRPLKISDAKMASIDSYSLLIILKSPS